MRILFISSIFPRPASLNRGIVCFHWCRALTNQGHSVRVVSPQTCLESRVRKGDVLTLPGAEALHVEYPRYYYPPGILRSTYDWWMWIGTRKTLNKTVAEFNPDCVISYWIHPDGAVAIRAARSANIPVAVLVGGSDALVLPQQSRSRRRKITEVLKAADAVVTVSQHLRDAVIRLGAPPERAYVVHTGVDSTLFYPGDRTVSRQRLGLPMEKRILLFVGNLVAVKGLEVMISACSLLRERSVDFRLYLVGDGPLRGPLEKEAAGLGLGEHVRFVGPVVQKDLPNWYRAANLAVLSSHSEGIPNVLRESLACGTPFVATDVGGVGEVAQDPVNRLVPPGHPVALAEAIETSLRSGPGRVQGVSGTWEESARRLIETLQPVMSKVTNAIETVRFEMPDHSRANAC